jgi:hypothetical protein
MRMAQTSPCYSIPKMCVNVKSLSPRYCRVLHVLRHGPPAARAVPDAAAAPPRRPVVWRRPLDGGRPLPHDPKASSPASRSRDADCILAAAAAATVGSHALNLVLQQRNKAAVGTHKRHALLGTAHQQHRLANGRDGSQLLHSMLRTGGAVSAAQ